MVFKTGVAGRPQSAKLRLGYWAALLDTGVDPTKAIEVANVMSFLQSGDSKFSAAVYNNLGALPTRPDGLPYHLNHPVHCISGLSMEDKPAQALRHFETAARLEPSNPSIYVAYFQRYCDCSN